MIEQRQGWILDVEGNAINLDQVRMVRICTQYAGPKYVETFHVEAHLSGYDTSDALRSILVRNLPDRVSAEHWIASRFWQPDIRLQ